MMTALATAAATLADVLEQENAALLRHDFPAAVELGAAKEAALLGMTKYRGVATGQEPALLALGRRVAGLLAENRALLERAIAVQTRIVGIIVRAATPQPASRQYAANGYNSQSRRTSAMALSARA